MLKPNNKSLRKLIWGRIKAANPLASTGGVTKSCKTNPFEFDIKGFIILISNAELFTPATPKKPILNNAGLFIPVLNSPEDANCIFVEPIPKKAPGPPGYVNMLSPSLFWLTFSLVKSTNLLPAPPTSAPFNFLL